VRFQVYSSDFDAPGYLDRSLLLAGKLNPQSAVNQTDGGSVAQQNVVLTYRQDGTEEPITATAYLLHNAFKRWDTFNLVPQSADAPGQALQYDNRIQTGVNLEKYFRWTLPYGMAADLLLGAGDRSDFIRARQDDTVHRDPVDQTQSVDFNQHDLFGYAQLDLTPLPWMKLTGGIRYDHFFFNIDDRTNRRAVSPNTGVPSPKAGIAIMPLSGLALYADGAHGN
jgi:outer membrane receptor protein involved in Fe transport